MSGASAVAFAAPAASSGSAAGLRGAAPAAAARAARAEARVEAGDAASPWLLGSAAALAGAAAAGASRRPARGSRRALPAATVAAAAGEAPAPPPPPPFDPAKAVGATAPLGYFDPLGFCKVGDYEGFHKLRSSELKHGRVAMMAAFGTAFQHFVKLPGFESTPAGLGAFADPLGVVGFAFLALPIGLVETVYWKDDDLSTEPGNFGDPGDWAGLFGAFGGGYSDEIRNKEINNGRMAMISVMGILVAEIATGKDGIQQFGL